MLLLSYWIISFVSLVRYKTILPLSFAQYITPLFRDQLFKMPTKRSRNNRRPRRRSPRNNGSRAATVIDRARAELSSIGTTSASGLFAYTAFLFSTSLNTRWAALANLYQRWRIKWMKFHYRGQVSTTYNGRVAMGVNEDADGANPTSFAQLMEVRCAAQCQGWSSMNLTYRPSRETWLWTADLSLNEDRLEYPGFLMVATGSFTSAVVPGYIWYEYEVEFSNPCNSTIALSRVLNFAKAGKPVNLLDKVVPNPNIRFGDFPPPPGEVCSISPSSDETRTSESEARENPSDVSHSDPSLDSTRPDSNLSSGSRAHIPQISITTDEVYEIIAKLKFLLE